MVGLHVFKWQQSEGWAPEASSVPTSPGLSHFGLPSFNIQYHMILLLAPAFSLAVRHKPRECGLLGALLPLPFSCSAVVGAFRSSVPDHYDGN